ncbi:MAG: acyltransferase [Sphingobacteriia bacterium]|nr:MAG: acyltransferase [Sphingobacteriia bacterium]
MKSKEYIPALTGVRGLAAFLIFLDHYNQTSFHPLLFRIFNEFHFPLPMFFVLSGFLICLRYYDNVEVNKHWMRKYIKNRIARVYPIYLILTVATFLVAWMINDNSIYNNLSSHFTVFLLNITFIRGFFDDIKFTGIGQGWSLTVEECFYFSAPFFFLLIQRTKKWLIYLPLLIMGAGVLLVLIFRNVDFYGFFGNFKFMFISTFFGRCVEFFVGMVLALIIRKSDDTISKIPFYTYLGILGIAGTTVIMVNQPLTAEVQFGLYQPVGIFTNNIILPFAIASFFYGLIKEKSVIRFLLSTPFGQLNGRSSYIFYLIHLGFIANFAITHIDTINTWFFEWLDARELYWITEHQDVIEPIMLLTFLFSFLTVVSIILYKYVEEPLNLYIRKSSFLETKKV